MEPMGLRRKRSPCWSADKYERWDKGEWVEGRETERKRHTETRRDRQREGGVWYGSGY